MYYGIGDVLGYNGDARGSIVVVGVEEDLRVMVKYVDGRNGQQIYGPYDDKVLRGWKLIEEQAPLQVGDVVRLSPESKWAGNGIHNPVGVEGVVKNLGLPIVVNWVHSENTYDREDLILIRKAPDAKPFAAKVKPKRLPDGLKEAIVAIQGIPKGELSTANYAYTYAEGGWGMGGNTACHAENGYHFTSNGHKGKGKTPKNIVSSIARGLEHKAYYRWLIDESAWAPCFKYRAAWSLKNGVVVVKTDINANLMHTALVATRSAWEHKRLVEVCELLFGMGIQKDVAYFLSMGLNTDGKKVRAWRYRYKSCGHFPFEEQPTTEHIKNFRNGTLVKCDNYNTFKKYQNTGGLFCGGNRAGSSIASLWKEKIGEEKDGWSKVCKKATEEQLKEFAKVLAEETK